MHGLTPDPSELQALNMVEVQIAKHSFDLALRKALTDFEAKTGLTVTAVDTSMLVYRTSTGTLDRTVFSCVELETEIPRTMGGPATLIV